MRRLLAGSLGLSLALWAGTGRADDSPVRLERPRPAAVLLPPAVAPAALARPVPVATSGDAVRQTSFATLRPDDPLVRAQAADVPQPLPVGPSAGLEAPGRLERPGAPVIIARRQNEKPNPETGPAPRPATPAPDAPAASPPPSIWGFGSGPFAEGPVADGPGGPCCGGPECGPDACCDGCRTPRFWISGEYLLWWVKDQHGPPLVTASPPGVSGILPGSMVLFSGDDLHYQERSGARFNAGFWFDDAHCFGLDGSFFFLGRRSANFTASSPPFVALARPFSDVTTGVPINAAEAVPGTVTVSSMTQLWGFDTNFRFSLANGPAGGWLGDGLLGWLPRRACAAPAEACECSGDAAACAPCAPCGPCAPSGWCRRWDLLVGFRYLGLTENLDITENLVAAGSRISETDHFETHNYFYGGQVGTQLELNRGRFFVDWTTKVALGATHQIVNITGATTFLPPPGVAIPASTAPGGLFAQPTNIGHYARNGLSVVPETGLRVGWQLTDHLRLFVGYNFLFWSNVARPADQIDPGVNQTQRAIPGPNGTLVNGMLIGPARPMFVFRDTDFWAHGASFGLEFRY
jgi:Putative beta barrel porin-7 (BBP7)